MVSSHRIKSIFMHGFDILVNLIIKLGCWELPSLWDELSALHGDGNTCNCRPSAFVTFWRWRWAPWLHKVCAWLDLQCKADRGAFSAFNSLISSSDFGSARLGDGITVQRTNMASDLPPYLVFRLPMWRDEWGLDLLSALLIKTGGADGASEHSWGLALSWTSN